MEPGVGLEKPREDKVRLEVGPRARQKRHPLHVEAQLGVGRRSLFGLQRSVPEEVEQLLEEFDCIGFDRHRRGVQSLETQEAGVPASFVLTHREAFPGEVEEQLFENAVAAGRGRGHFLEAVDGNGGRVQQVRRDVVVSSPVLVDALLQEFAGKLCVLSFFCVSTPAT